MIIISTPPFDISALGHKYVDRGDPAAFDFTLGNFTTDGGWHDLDLSGIVPAGTIAVDLRVQVQDELNTAAVNFRKKGNVNTVNVLRCSTHYDDDLLDTFGFVFCDVNRKIQYASNDLTFTAINFLVRGWLI